MLLINVDYRQLVVCYSATQLAVKSAMIILPTNRPTQRGLWTKPYGSATRQRDKPITASAYLRTGARDPSSYTSRINLHAVDRPANG